MKIGEAILQLMKIADKYGDDVELKAHVKHDADGQGERSTLYNPAPVTGIYARKDGWKSYHVQVIYDEDAR